MTADGNRDVPANVRAYSLDAALHCDEGPFASRRPSASKASVERVYRSSEHKIVRLWPLASCQGRARG